ncbi:MAG: hypothetical protein AAFS10_25795, partial [Myxococcota bacterium]
MNRSTPVIITFIVLIGCCALVSCATPRPRPVTPPPIPQSPPQTDHTSNDLPSILDLCPDDPDAMLMSSGELTALPTELQSLSDRLDEVGQTDADRPLVVVHYGDSHTKAASLPRELRELFGSGPASPGYIAPGHPMPGAWDASVSHSGAWTRHNWLYGRDTPSFGPMGLAYSTRAPGSRLRLKLKTQPAHGDRAKVTVLYQHTAGHLPFRLESEGTLLASIPTVDSPVNDFELGLVEVELPPDAQTMELTVEGERSSGEFRFYGALVQYPDAR